jgi:site-specific DNA-methyltransferase (adenine-specific)
LQSTPPTKDLQYSKSCILPYYQDATGKIIQGNVLDALLWLPDESVQCVVTSPPYWGLRDYGHPGQIGQEETPREFVQALVEVFREVRRVLKKDGTCWLNIGDTYNAYNANRGASTGISDGTKGRDHPTHKQGLMTAAVKNKCLLMIPARVAIALEADGWYLRQDIIWHKPNPMPESVTDRCTKSHEYIFLLTKSDRYYYDADAIKESSTYADCGRPSKVKGDFNAKGEPLPGQLPFRAITEQRNKRSVWSVPVTPFKGAHFATYPPDLIKPCILAGSRPGDMVLDPFGGSGTTGQVALELGRRATLIELNPEYANIIDHRTNVTPGLALV